MLPLSVPKCLIMACHFTGIYDVNRNTTLQDDDITLVQDWVASLEAQDLPGIIFHNNFSEATCAKFQHTNITLIKTAYATLFSPNVYRYFVYRDFLRQHAAAVESLFVTDVSDVVVLQNPFIQPLFTDHPATIFCGDEPKSLDDAWMKAHATHLRNQMADYADYEEKFKAEPLLNCGIIGGNIGVMLPFIEKLCLIHQQYNHHNQTAYTGDMGAFNYLARTQFQGRILHGSPINTEFKAYQYDRKDCWFRHK